MTKSSVLWLLTLMLIITSCSSNRLIRAYEEPGDELIEQYISEWYADTIPTDYSGNDTLQMIHDLFVSFYAPRSSDLYIGWLPQKVSDDRIAVIQPDLHYCVVDIDTFPMRCNQRGLRTYLNKLFDSDSTYNCSSIENFRPDLNKDSILYLSEERKTEILEFLGEWNNCLSEEEEARILEKGVQKASWLYKESRLLFTRHKYGGYAGPSRSWYLISVPEVITVYIDHDLTRAKVFFTLKNYDIGVISYIKSDDHWDIAEKCVTCLECGDW